MFCMPDQEILYAVTGRVATVTLNRPAKLNAWTRTMEQDVRILRWFIRSVLWLIPAARRLQPYDLVDELARNLAREIDLRQETMNNKRFGEIFRGSPEITVPEVIDGLHTEWVMVQEMVTGRRIDDPALAAQGPRLARALVEAYLWMFFHEGVFHADPHPGNLMVMAGPKLVMVDFGQVKDISPAFRFVFGQMTRALLKDDDPRRDPWWSYYAADWRLYYPHIDRVRALVKQP